MAIFFAQNGFLLVFSLSSLLTQPCLTSPITGNKQTTLTNNTITYSDEFSFSCLPLITQVSDPIFSPGRESLHTHVVTGGTAFQRTMGMQTARNAHETTCEAVYYLNRACSYAPGARECPNGVYPLAPPAGLRVVAGNPMLQTYNDSDIAQRAISHMCIGKNGKLRSQVFFPSCWDGKNLDSPDHKSHLAYPAIGDYNKGVCPESHPIAIFSIFFEFIFNTEPFPDYQNLLYASGDRTGYGLHGDFINGWTDQVALHSAFETCTGKGWLAVAPLSLKAEVTLPWAELGQNRTIPVLPGHPEHAY
ncbi:hypothetical protein BDW75DRAFT_231244 [Aspergillus navahoensis]